MEVRVMVKILKRRYIDFGLNTTSPLTQRDVAAIVRGNMHLRPLTQETRTGLRLILYDPEKKLGMIRCNHRNLKEVKSFLNSLGETELGAHTLRASGTIRTLQEEFHIDKGG